MRRTKTSVLPGVDVMETRLLLSTAAPHMARRALTGIVHDIKAIVSTLARTDNTVQAGAQLTGLSSQVPSGSASLLNLSWQIDLGLFRPHSQRSAITTEKRLLGDLYRAIESAGSGGSGPGSASTPPTVPAGYTAPTPTPISEAGRDECAHSYARPES